MRINGVHQKRSGYLFRYLIGICVFSFVGLLSIGSALFANQYLILIHLPISILAMVHLRRDLVKLKWVFISSKKIKVIDYWNGNVEFSFVPETLTEVLYHQMKNGTQPWAPIAIKATDAKRSYEFSIKGFYDEDLEEFFKQFDCSVKKGHW